MARSSASSPLHDSIIELTHFRLQDAFARTAGKAASWIEECNLTEAPAAAQSDFTIRPRAGILLCYNTDMTFMEATFELQSPLTEQQMRQLGEFANTYGLRRFRVDGTQKLLTFEYDASRLKESQVAHVLGQVRIRVLRRVDPFAAAGVPA